MDIQKRFNLFRATCLFLYLLKTSQPEVFWCFQEVLKETSDMKKVDLYR